VPVLLPVHRLYRSHCKLGLTVTVLISEHVKNNSVYTYSCDISAEIIQRHTVILKSSVINAEAIKRKTVNLDGFIVQGPRQRHVCY
jgi:hypothetical protein